MLIIQAHLLVAFLNILQAMKNYLDNSNIQIKDRFFLIVRANVVNFQV